MNERIRELAKQADNYAYKMNPEQDSYGRSANPRKFQQDRDAKFAELLIRECLDIIKHNICELEYRGGSQILESYENYQANRRSEDILNQIQKHFGVEE
jgi:hypothetical protein